MGGVIAAVYLYADIDPPDYWKPVCEINIDILWFNIQTCRLFTYAYGGKSFWVEIYQIFNHELDTLHKVREIQGLE
jgi:hypothetical protein